MNKVIVKNVNGDWEVRNQTFETTDSYEYIRGIVEGYVEAMRVRKDIVIWLNEEGKLLNMTPNVALVLEDTIVDFIVGNIVVTGVTEEGDTIPLNAEQVNYFIDMAHGKARIGDTIVDCLMLKRF